MPHPSLGWGPILSTQTSPSRKQGGSSSFCEACVYAIGPGAKQTLHATSPERKRGGSKLPLRGKRLRRLPRRESSPHNTSPERKRGDLTRPVGWHWRLARLCSERGFHRCPTLPGWGLMDLRECAVGWHRRLARQCLERSCDYAQGGAGVSPAIDPSLACRSAIAMRSRELAFVGAIRGRTGRRSTFQPSSPPRARSIA